MLKTVFNLEFCYRIVWKNSNKEKSSNEKVLILVNKEKHFYFQIMKKKCLGRSILLGSVT